MCLKAKMERFFCLAYVCDIPLNRSKYTFFLCTKTILSFICRGFHKR